MATSFMERQIAATIRLNAIIDRLVRKATSMINQKVPGSRVYPRQTATSMVSNRDIMAMMTWIRDIPPRNSRAERFDIFSLSRVFASGSLTMVAEAEKIIMITARIIMPGTYNSNSVLCPEYPRVVSFHPTGKDIPEASLINRLISSSDHTAAMMYCISVTSPTSSSTVPV